MDFHRLNYLWNKPNKTEAEKQEFNRLYHQEEYLNDLDGDRGVVEDSYDEEWYIIPNFAFRCVNGHSRMANHVQQNKSNTRWGYKRMYNYFKSVLKVTKEKHKKALQGKSSGQKKLQTELLQVQKNLYESYYYRNEMTEKEYKELATEFNRISFINLSDQRNGKLKLWKK